MRLVATVVTASLAALTGQVAGPVAPTIEPGDRIQILVLDDPALNVPDVEVQQDGKIYHPLIGEITVAGQDRVGLAEHIADRLQGEIREPHVAVNIVAKRPLPAAYVLGEVSKPGAHPIIGAGTVREMLVQAGGMTDRAAANRTVIIAASGQRRVVDLGPGLAERADPESIPVAEGDCIFVPGQNAIAVIGAVVQPGSVFLPDSASLQMALAAAGGLAPDADPDSLTLVRDGEKTILPQTGDGAGPELAGGDAIIVGTREVPQMTVLGEVSKQGTYPVEGGCDVATLLAAAGGATERADLARVKLLRVGTPSVMLDLRDLLASGASANNLPLGDGDTLIVPARRPERATVWGAVRTPGMYDLEDSNRLLDVIAQAGGLAKDAEKRYVVVVKAADRVAHQVALPNPGKIADGAQLGADVELEDGDIVFVPARGSKFEWRDALTALGVITLMIDRF